MVVELTDKVLPGSSKMGSHSVNIATGEATANVLGGQLPSAGSESNEKLNTEAINVANHEIGHGVGLEHPTKEVNAKEKEFDDGNIMGTQVNPTTYGDAERPFSEANKNKLQERLNEKEDEQ